MQNLTLGREIDRELLKLYLKAHGPAVDPSRDQISTGKASTTAPRDYGDDHGLWRDRFERLLLALKRETGAERLSKPRVTAKDLLPVIRQYEGRDAVYVAFVEGCSPRLVEKCRTIIGVSTSDGTAKQRPLTSRELSDDLSVRTVTLYGVGSTSMPGSGEAS